VYVHPASSPNCQCVQVCTRAPTSSRGPSRKRARASTMPALGTSPTLMAREPPACMYPISGAKEKKGSNCARRHDDAGPSCTCACIKQRHST
jgi:hypothetical protein